MRPKDGYYTQVEVETMPWAPASPVLHMDTLADLGMPSALTGSAADNDERLLGESQHLLGEGMRIGVWQSILDQHDRVRHDLRENQWLNVLARSVIAAAARLSCTASMPAWPTLEPAAVHVPRTIRNSDCPVAHGMVAPAVAEAGND